MFKRAVALIIGALVAAVLVGGCGGGSGNSSSSTAAENGSTGSESTAAENGSSAEKTESSSSKSASEGLKTSSDSKAEFVKKANAICVATTQKLTSEIEAELKKSQGSGLEFNEESLAATVIVPAIESEIEELRALGAPSGGEQQVGAFLDSIQEVVDNAKTDPSTLVTTHKPYRAAEKLGDPYGLTSCPVVN